MCDNGRVSLHTLPIDIIYCILDNLNELQMIVSVRDVCSRLNSVVDSYQRYRVRIYNRVFCLF